MLAHPAAHDAGADPADPCFAGFRFGNGHGDPRFIPRLRVLRQLALSRLRVNLMNVLCGDASKAHAAGPCDVYWPPFAMPFSSFWVLFLVVKWTPAQSEKTIRTCR